MQQPASYLRALEGDLTSVADADARTAEGALLRSVEALFLCREPPDPRVVRPTSLDDARLLSLACAHGVLAGVVGLDRTLVARAAEGLQELHRSWPNPHADACLRTAHGWQALAGGGWQEAERCATAAGHLAQELALGPLVVESVAQRALAALGEGDLDSAVERARRAARMARSEGLLPYEYLTALILARARRFTRKPYLATRIVQAVAAVATDRWADRIGWELRMAGGPAYAVAPGAAARSPAHQLASARLDEMLAAATGGDRHHFDESVAMLERLVAPWADLRTELDAVRAAVDPGHREATAISGWLRGDSDAVPGVLAGLAAGHVDVEGAEQVGAFVLCGPPSEPRRVLRAGCGLVLGPGGEPPTYPWSQHRTLTAAAALALAGPHGIGEVALFEALYGFPFVAGKHDGAYRTLLYRTRALLGEHASLERSAGKCRLVPRSAILLPDPRCAPEPDELILRTLAANGGRASARDVAETLGLPLRTVQAALKGLVDDGACTAARDGRRVEYRLEDTTFAEPTFTRMAPRL